MKPKFVVLVNGIPSSWFHSSMGLRQGCPLSPFLFVLCSDVPSRMLSEIVIEGNVKAHQPTSQSPRISHIMFADDLV